MITGKLVFLAIQYLDPDPLPPHARKREIDERHISQADVFQAIKYLELDLEKSEDIKPPADTKVSHVIQYLDPDLGRQPTRFKLRWLPRWVRRFW